MIHLSTYFHPKTLLLWFLFMPQLETLAIGFLFPVPDRDIERQLIHTPIVTPIPLPNLHRFIFRGVSAVSAYLGALVPRPRHKSLRINFFNRLTFFVPCLLQFINTTKILGFESAKLKFLKGEVYVEIYPHGEAEMYAFAVIVDCWPQLAGISHSTTF